MRSFKVTALPQKEPVTPTQVKRLIHLDFDSEDEELADQIGAARQWLEKKLSKALITQTIQLISTLGDDALHTHTAGLIGRPSALAVELSPGPVQTVTTVEIETATNVWRALNEGTEYLLDNTSPDAPALLAIADFTLANWFGTTGGIGIFPLEYRGPRLRVTYQAGYGNDASSVPYSLRECIKRAAGYLYDNPGEMPPDDLLPTDYIPWRL